LGTTVKNRNLIQEEIKRILNSGNTCYHSVQNLLSSRLLSKNVKLRTHETIILPVVLCGCETWSLTLREEQRLRVLENRVLRRIYKPKRGEIIGGWRKRYGDEIHNLYSFPSIITITKSWRMRWEGNVARIGNNINAYRILEGKPDGNRLSGRSRRRWVNNIKIDF
jgi:hypothetical protein